MDPVSALLLAQQAIQLGDALLNAYIATKGAMDAAQAAAMAARLAALTEANASLNAKLQRELQAIIDGGSHASQAG